MNVLWQNNRHLKLIDKILRSVPDTPVTLRMLSKISESNPHTLTKWLEIIEYAQNHEVKVVLTKTTSESKTFRIVSARRTKNDSH